MIDTSKWGEAKVFRRTLADEGWFTPNTYDSCFEYPIDGPAVYLFLLWESEWMERAIVAYVGMSSRLAQRWMGHPVLAEISQPGFYVQRWFRPTPKPELRAREKQLIERFDPPWNIQGRKRGLVLQ